MPRPASKTPLVPRQPRTVLGWTMRKLREAAGESVTSTARAFGCDPSHITRVELGQNRPSRELVQFYGEIFRDDGMLSSLLEVVDHQAEQERRRAGGHRPDLTPKRPGDSSAFVDQQVPNGTLMRPGEQFTETWRIRNSGSVVWTGRRVERQGPRTGPGLITSARYYALPDTKPGQIATITADLKAPTYDCTSIAYFKMVDADGNLCYPDNYQLGLEVVVMVRGQLPDKPSLLEATEP